MNTLTPLHDELDASLALILDRIDTQAMKARWRLEDMYWDAWRTRPFPVLIRDSSKRLSDLLTGHAFDRVIGNEPWHFEFTPTKLPWWKRNALYRAFKRYRFARMYGASKKKALGVKIWPRRNERASR